MMALFQPWQKQQTVSMAAAKLLFMSIMAADPDPIPQDRKGQHTNS